jgi:predicted ATPase
MKLVRVRIFRFQSFGDSGDISFCDGINLIVGQNNAGKSALLRAMLPSLPDDRHRTPELWQHFLLASPKVEFAFEVSGAEIRDSLLRSRNENFVPIPIRNLRAPEQYLDEVFSKKSLEISVCRSPNSSFSSVYPSHLLFAPDTDTQKVCASIISVNGRLVIGNRLTDEDSLPGLLFMAWESQMFYLAPERMTVGEAPIGRAERLLPNASNLPNVLHTLSAESTDVFTRLVVYLRYIFPTVGNLSVRAAPNGSLFEVLVWPTESRERVELSFPLNSSGTGVSQVVAILAALMTGSQSIMLIDEINSFLHPSAVKALLRILKTDYAGNQYIISTHAPEVIGFSNPAKLHLVKRVGYETLVEQLDLAEVGKFREVAEHLGVSMADVFAADKVIWVEGQTEELCFPYLYQRLVGPLPLGTVFTAVVATGDFSTKRRDREFVFKVYDRLSSSVAGLPITVLFSFDTETLSEDEKSRMAGAAGRRLYFLPRRHFECYLVDAEAISAFVVDKDLGAETPATPASVEAAIRTVAERAPIHIPEWNGDLNDVDWLARVDAARLISKVCGSVSNERVCFNKKDDSLYLLQQILAQDAPKLEPLLRYVKALVDNVSTRQVHG